MDFRPRRGTGDNNSNQRQGEAGTKPSTLLDGIGIEIREHAEATSIRPVRKVGGGLATRSLTPAAGSEGKTEAGEGSEAVGGLMLPWGRGGKQREGVLVGGSA